MKRILSVLALVGYLVLNTGCTCDCDVCTEIVGEKMCETVADVRKSDCTAEGRCEGLDLNITCSAACR